MTAPDGERCYAFDDGTGHPATVRGSGDLGPRGEQAMRNLIAAARRHADQLDPDGTRAARQQAALARIRDRNRRLRDGQG